MKIWWVLGWYSYYPAGGLGNVIDTFETEEEANAYVSSVKIDNGSGYRSCPDFVEVCDVSSLLGI